MTTQLGHVIPFVLSNVLQKFALNHLKAAFCHLNDAYLNAAILDLDQDLADLQDGF